MNILDLFKRKKINELENSVDRWNYFISDICEKDLDDLNEIQRKAVLCFWYDAEMGSGGHSGYFDCYPDTDPKELYAAIKEISNKKIADNYKKALKSGEADDYVETDNAYYEFDPDFASYLEKYVEDNKDSIFFN